MTLLAGNIFCGGKACPNRLPGDGDPGAGAQRNGRPGALRRTCPSHLVPRLICGSRSAEAATIAGSASASFCEAVSVRRLNLPRERRSVLLARVSGKVPAD